MSTEKPPIKPRKKKELQKCRKCGVELSFRELNSGVLCFVCDRDEFQKDQDFRERHHGAVRP
jgi:hypothetical protein